VKANLWLLGGDINYGISRNVAERVPDKDETLGLCCTDTWTQRKE
jgi:hypothetical protein